MAQQDMFNLGKKNKARTNYSYKGKKNKTAFPKSFVKICKYGQRELKAYLNLRLLEFYNAEDVTVGDGFIYAKGITPVCLTAHMDTVHKEKVREFYGYYDKKNDRNIISSPQGIGGDDRCGVFMIMEVLRTTDYRPSIIFCEDEEIGGIGSDKFCRTGYLKELEEVKFFIELDRANGNDLVFYDDDNTEFHEWCEKVTEYKENYGSFSDIGNFCPNIGISGVNISCGYYNAHSTDEYVVLEEMMSGIKTTKKLLKASAELEKPFEYVDGLWKYRNKSGLYGWYGYGNSFDSYNSYSSLEGDNKEKDEELTGLLKDYRDYNNPYETYDCTVGMVFTYGNGTKQSEVWGISEMDCLGQFLIDNPTLSYEEIEEIEYL